MINILKRAESYLFSSTNHEQRKWDLLAVSFYGFLMLFLPFATFDWDSYVRWAEKIRVLGFANIYQHFEVNYMPLNVFAVQIWQMVCGWMGWPLNQYFQLIKIYPMIFDALTVLLLYRVARRYGASLLTVALLFLPNIAFQYNSFIWGQFDGVYTFFVLLSGFFVMRKQPVAAVTAFVLALNSKIQAVVFLPTLLAFLWLYVFQPQSNRVFKFAKTMGIGLGIGVVLQGLLLLPFTGNNPLQILELVIARSASLSTWVTFNADNFWTLLGVGSMTVSDKEVWIGLMTYHEWGYLLLALFTGLTFLPLGLSFLAGFSSVRTRFSRLHIPQVQLSQLPEAVVMQLFALVAYLQALGFFYFMTQMHERYSHPAILFAGLFALLSRKRFIFLLTCVAYVLNLEKVNLYWRHLIDLSGISWIGQLSAALFLTGLVLALASLYKLYLTQAGRNRAG